tara:strand:+ start:1039 stop:1488 length:450 start_codon:yes stop_codon:yes gene_type:complete
MSQSSKQSSKGRGKKLKIKVSKKTIENKINELYPNSDLYKKELSYDIDINEEFKKNLIIDGEEPNLEIINNLPKLILDTKIIEDNEIDLDETDNNEVENEIDDDIDKEALELETVGSKKYYMDYSKGIIYDLQYKAIGNIDEFGDINIS